MIRILAIDPGPLESAYVLYEHERDPMTRRNIIERPIIEKAKVPNGIVLARIAVGGFDALCIEKVASYGMTVGESVFETVFWTGRFAQHHSQFGGFAERITRMEVKMHLCHTSRAKDTNIRQELINRFGAPGTTKHQGKTFGVSGDIWSALAVAVTFAEGGHTERPMQARPTKQPTLRQDAGAGTFDTDLDKPLF